MSRPECFAIESFARTLSGLLLVAVAVSCAHREIDDEDPPPPGKTCASQSCPCPNGERGWHDVCSDGTKTECSCGSCTELPLDPPNEIQACGGDPTGVWRSTDVTVKGLSAFINYSGKSAQCGTSIASEPTGGDFRMQLDPAKSGKAYFKSLTLQFKTWNSCVATAVPNGCNNADLHCTSDDCGVCSCNQTINSHLAGNVDWSLGGSSLHLTSSDGVTMEMDYCVSGPQMDVVMAGMLVKMEKVTPTGTPAPCASRSAAECTLGFDCQQGACSGSDPSCAQYGEAACATYPGCQWDPKGCSGTPSPQCELTDYDVIPGCVFVP